MKKMKSLIRTLCLLLCVSLLTSNLSVALMEDGQIAAIEIPEMEMTLAADSESPAQIEAEPEPQPEMDAVEMTVEDISAEADPEEAPAESVESGDVPAEEAIVDYGLSAAENPAFTQGYALVLEKTALYAGGGASDAQIGGIGKGVAYVLRRVQNEASDRLEIAFLAKGENEARFGWIDAASARPIDPEDELPAYLEACADRDSVIHLNGSADLPLAALDYAAPEDQEDAPEDQEALAEIVVEPMLTAAEENAANENNENNEKNEPQILSLCKTSIKLGKGEVLKVSDLFVTEPENAEIGYTLKTSKKAYVTVDNATGSIKGVKNGGSSTITITPDNGQPALVLKVSVLSAATKISLKPASLRMVQGMAEKLTVGFNSSKYYGSYRLESADPAIAEVDADGLVTAHSVGVTQITASLIRDPSKTAVAEITVLPVPDRIAASTETLVLNQGQKSKAIYGKLPEDLAAVYGDAAPCRYIYTSSNPEIADVDENTGEVTANNFGLTGETTITIAAHNNPSVTASCTLRVISLKLRANAINLAKGESADLADWIELLPEDGEGNFTYKSSNAKIVSVDANGVITGKTAGKNATITISAGNGLPNLKLKVYVRNAATKIALKPAEISIGEQMSGKLNISFNSKSYYGAYTIKSSNPEIASVDANGNLFGNAEGVAAITVSLNRDPSIQDSSTVRVLAAPEHLEGSVASLKLGNGQKSDAFYGIISEAAPCELIYRSSNPEIASVDAENGTITANSSGLTGSAIITVSAHNNPEAYAQCAVEVVPDPDSITLKQTTLKIAKGEIVDIEDVLQLDPIGSAAGYSLKTSNKKVVSVSADGRIKGVKNGSSATITITPHNGLPALKLKVGVYKKPASISLKPAEILLGQQMQEKVSVSFKSGYYGSYSLSSDQPNVARVDANGVITAGEAGEATITATLNSDPSVQDSVHVTVQPAPKQVQASLDALKLGRGQTSNDLYGEAETLCNFIYESDHPEIASVDASTGALSAHANGLAQIRISAHNNPEAYVEIPVLVVDPPMDASLLQSSLTIGKGNTYDIRELVQLDPADSAAGYSFKTSNKKVVTVDANGVIRGIKAGGSAYITITTHNGINVGRVKVSVKKAPASYSMRLSTDAIGMQMPAKATVKFASGYSSLYEIVSSDPSVASVDADGNITAIAPGSTIISVRNPNGSDAPKAASAELTVYAAPDRIEISHDYLKLSAAQSFHDLKAAYPEGTMCDFIFSCDADWIRVDEASGKITVSQSAQIGDTAQIRVAAHNNPEAFALCTVEIVKQPETAQLLQDQLTIGVGDTFDLKQLVELEAGSAASFSFTSSNKSYASVDADGWIKGVKAGGNSNIKITTHNGIEVGSVKVSVKKAPTSIKLTPDALTLGVGMQGKLAVSFASSSDYGLYTISSSDESIARVDADGNVLALREGSAEIIAETQNGKQARMIVSVVPAPTSVEFVETEREVAESMQVDLREWVQLDAGSMADFSFTSSNPEIASIDGNILTALRGGETEISVTTHNGVQNSLNCKVTVVPAPNKLDFNDMPKLVIAVGDTIVLPEPIATDAYGDVCPTTFSYSLNQSGYAAYVRLDGNQATGLKAGTVQVKVSAHNGVFTTLTLQVASKTITALELNYSEADLYLNESLNYAETLDLSADFVSAANINSGTLHYASSDPSIVRVEERRREDGSIYARLTAQALGEAEITVRAFNGVQAVCKLHVKKLSATLAFAESSVTITEGKTHRLQPLFDEGCSAKLNYTSSKPDIAAVDETTGEITAIQPGQAVITAAGQNGLSASVQIKVIAGPTGVHMDVHGISLEIGESITLRPEISVKSEETDRSLSFESSNVAVARVDANGTVQAVTPGEATILVETCNGHTAQCTIYVLNEGDHAQVEFGWESATMVKGDHAELNFCLNKAAYENGFSITSSKPSALAVNEEDWTIHAKAASADGVTLTLTIHSAEGDVDSLPESYTAKVVIVDSLSPKFSQSKISLQTYSELKPENSQAELLLTGVPADLIGSYKLYVEDEALASYDPIEGIVRAASELTGETYVICEVYGAKASCLIQISSEPVYRAVIIAEYNNSSQTGSNLPFAANNVKSMRTTLQNAYIDGKTYEKISYLPSNPTQAQIKSAIQTTFADAKEGDVSLIYIVSHGYYTAERGYYFGTPNWKWEKQDTVIRSGELMDWMRPIEGNVVLVLDSCKSGGFIKDQQSALAAEGNIAVITAQTYDKNASYFAGASAATQVEFLTYVFCQGLGYSYDSKSWGSMRADSNGDGKITVNEIFSYTKNQVPKLVKQKAETEGWLAKGVFKIPGVNNWSDYYKWGSQNPQTYIPDAMKNLVIYGE